MMKENKLSELIKHLRPFARAKHPVDPSLLTEISYFEKVFPEKDIWPVFVSLALENGKAFIERLRFTKGEKIIARGQQDQKIYWILSGHTQVITMIQGQPKVIHEAGKGECLGELGVLKGSARSADVRAGKDGVEVLCLDWAICGLSSELGQKLYQLIALHMADKLDCAYDKQLKIIGNSIKVLHDKTSMLIEKNRMLEGFLKKHNIDLGEEMVKDHEEALEHAIATIKESLSLLTVQESKNNLDKLGLV